jgi:hypothetical protein
MQTLLIIICGLIIGHLIKKCNRLQAENQRLRSLPLPTEKLKRYEPRENLGDAFMVLSPNGAWVRWQDVAKPQPTGGRLVQEPRP